MLEQRRLYFSGDVFGGFYTETLAVEIVKIMKKMAVRARSNLL